MKIFSSADVLRVARRLNNSKRNFLLVNPLQGKHLPTRPSDALDMMNALGSLVAEKFSAARPVIGFAETATAIGALVAKNLSDECFYLHTTRENFDGKFAEFLEEHSHAPEQKLFAENLSEKISSSPEIIFVDDELSTGKTLLNIVRQLKKIFPALDTKKICAASIINRLTEENLAALAAEKISCVSLVRLEQKTFDVEKFSVTEAKKISPLKKNISTVKKIFTGNPRRGVKIGEYFSECARLANVVDDRLRREKICGEILILGTEEFMLPALVVGEKLEENFSVVTHSTTRSPIGICAEKNYPIRSGFKLRSFYDAAHTTYIYNLKNYDAAVIVSDAENFSAGLEDLISALNVCGVDKIFFVRC